MDRSGGNISNGVEEPYGENCLITEDSAGCGQVPARAAVSRAPPRACGSSLSPPAQIVSNVIHVCHMGYRFPLW